MIIEGERGSVVMDKIKEEEAYAHHGSFTREGSSNVCQ